MKEAKEMKKFAITTIVMAILILGVITFGFIKGVETSGMLPIGAGILFAIGFSLLPKAIKLEKLHKNNEL